MGVPKVGMMVLGSPWGPGGGAEGPGESMGALGAGVTVLGSPWGTRGWD
jgi:hypothetical protein